MSLQWIGPALSLATLLTIAMGHVLVRRLYARFGTRPALPFLLLGLTLLALSLGLRSDFIAALMGVFGITFFWDGVEFFRQARRMQHEGEP